MSENDSEDYFSSLCNMAENLEEELAEIYNDIREYCGRCERPVTVCLCPYLPEGNFILEKNIKIWVFQHPYEEKRTLRTTRILETCLDEANFVILKGKRFNTLRYPELDEVYENPNTFVLYPSKTAISLEQFRTLIEENEKSNSRNDNLITNNDIVTKKTTDDRTFHVILIDGTWDQASGIYWNNLILQQLKQISLNVSHASEYKIRTQPRECFLSTLETIAVILSTIEKKPQLYDDMVKPLRALCEYQIKFGAVCHQSKEYLLVHGKYTKPISEKNRKLLTKNTKIKVQQDDNNNQDIVS